MRLSIWKKNDTSLQTCLNVFVITQNMSKTTFCVDGQMTPYKIWSTHFRIQQPYTKNIENETKCWEKILTLHYRPVSLCLLLPKTRPKMVFVWTVK